MERETEPLENSNMSHVSGVSNQVRHKSGCTATEGG